MGEIIRASGDLSASPEQASFPLLERFVASFRSSTPPEHLLFGDSVALRVAAGEPDATTLEDMVAGLMAPAGTCRIALSAFHSQVYCLFCHCIARLAHRPRTVVMPINLRSFSTSWDLHPDYQFLTETALLDDYAHGKRIGREPLAANPVARAIFQAIPVRLASGEVLPVSHFLNRIGERDSDPDSPAWRSRLSDIFSFHYMEEIHPRHRKLAYFGTAIKCLRRHGIGVGLYLTPINHVAGETYVGPEFKRVVSRNVQVVLRFLGHYGIVETRAADLEHGRQPMGAVLDCTFDHDASAFFTPQNATEHLRHSARQDLARKIALLMNTIGQEIQGQ